MSEAARAGPRGSYEPRMVEPCDVVPGIATPDAMDLTERVRGRARSFPTGTCSSASSDAAAGDSEGTAIDGARLTRRTMADNVTTDISRATAAKRRDDVEELHAIASSPAAEPSGRAFALRDLARRRNHRAYALAIEGLSSSDLEYRRAAIAALADVGTEADVARLLGALRDATDDYSRWHVYDALGEIGDRSSDVFAALRDGMHEQKWHGRRSAALALQAIGGPDAAAILRDGVKSERRWGRRFWLSRQCRRTDAG